MWNSKSNKIKRGSVTYGKSRSVRAIKMQNYGGWTRFLGVRLTERFINKKLIIFPRAIVLSSLIILLRRARRREVWGE